MMPPVPRGFHFRPTDEDLITYYLLRKARGEELPWHGIQETDLYGEKSPWEICNDLYDHEEEKFYVFTNLKKLSRNRVARSAGCGTWHENNGDKIYDSQGEYIIGTNKMFCFKVKEGSGVKKSNWIMHEYSLAGVSLLGLQEGSANLVLCAIHNKGSEARRGLKRRSEDLSCISYVPGTITHGETLCNETPQPLNTNVLLLEEGNQQRKEMRLIVLDSDGRDDQGSDQMPLASSSDFGRSAPEFIPSQNYVDTGKDTDTQTNHLETNMGSLPNTVNSVNIGEGDMGAWTVDSEFHALHGYDLPPPPSEEANDPSVLVTPINFNDADDEFCDSTFFDL